MNTTDAISYSKDTRKLTTEKVYELQVFDKITVDYFCFHFKVDSTLEQRVKDLIVEDAISTRDIYKQLITDDEIKNLVSELEIKEGEYFHLRVSELMLHYSGQYRDLM